MDKLNISTGIKNEKKAFPERVYFQITRQCNLLCPYCFISANKNGGEVPFSHISKLIYFFAENRLKEVRLTGGEPTLHSHFKEIVDLFEKNGISVSVGTNGFWDKDTLEYFKTKKLFLIISLDGNREINEKHRGKSYDVVLDNIKKLRTANNDIKIRLNTVLTKLNYLNIEHLFYLADLYSIDYINFIPLKSQVRCDDIKANLLSAEDYEIAVNLMFEYRKKYNVKFNTAILSSHADEIMKDGLYKRKCDCPAGKEATNLDYDVNRKVFRMYGCSYCPITNLNYKGKMYKFLLAGEFDIIHVNKFKEIWNDDNAWKIFRKYSKPENCMSCSKLGNGCVGACIVQNLDYNKLEISENIEREVLNQITGMRESYCRRDL